MTKCTLFVNTGKMTPFVNGCSSAIFLNTETNEECPCGDLPAGAMYFTDDDFYTKGPDGRALCVKLPNGDIWMVDRQAANCTMPDDMVHRCWVRHGDAPNITVDKNGYTCAAGAGSIDMGGWHGFLRNGYLEQCQ